MKNAQLLSMLCLTTLMTTSVFCSEGEPTTAAPEIYPPITVTQPNGDELTLENVPTVPTTPAPVVTETLPAINNAAASVQEEVTKAGCFATAVVSLKEQGNKLATYVCSSRAVQFVQSHPKASSALVATVVVAGIAWYYKDAIKSWVNKQQANKA